MKELTLEITQSCDQYCPWCSSTSYQSARHVDVETLKRTLKHYRSTCDTVRLSGGEPTQHPKFAEIYKYAEELEYSIVLLTHGFKDFSLFALGPYDIVVDVVNDYSLEFAHIVDKMSPHVKVSLHVVAASGNEKNILKAVEFAITEGIPLHILKLQRQGRGQFCERSRLITWTGINGCDRKMKITVAHDGTVSSCTALKYKSYCDGLER